MVWLAPQPLMVKYFWMVVALPYLDGLDPYGNTDAENRMKDHQQ
jgi:hypothetical protein